MQCGENHDKRQQGAKVAEGRNQTKKKHEAIDREGVKQVVETLDEMQAARGDHHRLVLVRQPGMVDWLGRGTHVGLAVGGVVDGVQARGIDPEIVAGRQQSGGRTIR